LQISDAKSEWKNENREIKCEREREREKEKIDRFVQCDF